MEAHWKFRGGGGPQKPKFKGKYKAKLEIPGEWEGGSNQKTFRKRGYGYFQELHNDNTE